MSILRDLSASYLRTLRRNLEIERRENARLQSEIARLQDDVTDAQRDRLHHRDEAARLTTLLAAESARCRELEVERDLLSKENELLAAVVERQHQRVLAETVVHLRLIEGEGEQA